MRTAVISALGFLLAAGSSAWAQSPYYDRDRAGDRSGASSDSRSDAYGSSRSSARNGGYGASRSGDADHSTRYSRWSRDDDDDKDNDHHHWRSTRHKGHGSSGPGFFMKSGDKAWGVDCGSETTISECADAALKLFRETQSAQTHTGGASSTTSTSPTAPTPGAGGIGGSTSP